MGYEPPSTVYALDFEETAYRGLQVKMRATRLGALFDSSELLGAQERIDTAVLPTPEDADLMLGQFRELADHLVSWNVVDKQKQPVPADLEGLKKQELPMVRAIAEAWRFAMAGVSAPLSHGSSSGPLPDLPSLPMGSIPESLLSSSMPS